MSKKMTGAGCSFMGCGCLIVIIGIALPFVVAIIGAMSTTPQ